MFWFKIISVLITTFLLLNKINCNDEEVVSVRLNAGVINGKIETSVDNKKINVFKGIPFAEPPIGDLRFKKPQPLREWPKTLDAYEWPNTCLHSKKFGVMVHMLKKKNFSEDCLYLNIWSPENSLNSDKLSPVLFYIHGGALIAGSSSSHTNDMKVIATKGDVVTVTINYRLNAFGFLYTGTDDAPGNVGLWDQALALEWVNDNIRYFGGDPNQITIMGLSAGSWSVSLHLLSPITRNLFQNAILQSGAYVDHMIDGEYSNQIEIWLKGAELIGCNPNKVTDKFTDEIIQCIQEADPADLAGIADKPEMQLVSTGFFPFVVVDGHFLPKKPTAMLRSGDFKKNANLLISTAADEGSMFLSFWGSETFGLSEFAKKEFNYDQAYEELATRASKLSTKHKIDGEDVARVYLSKLSRSSDSPTLKWTMSIAIGDFILGCGPLLFAKELFRNSDYKTNIYQYYWNRLPTTKRKFGAPSVDWAGPGHGMDDEDTKGMPFIIPEDIAVYDDEQKALSEQMISFFTNFVKTGNPGQIRGTDWPKYFTIDDHIIAPYYEINNSDKSETNFGIGLKITECEYLWKKYLM